MPLPLRFLRTCTTGLLSLILITYPSLADATSQPALQSMQAKSLAAPPFSTSAGFLSAIGETLYASAPDAGQNILWKRTPGDSGQWEKTSITLPSHAAAAKWRSSIICVGGENASGPVSDVTLISEADGKVVETFLPPLPQPLTGAAAAVIGDNLYVIGGSTSAGQVAPTTDFRILNLTHPSDWRQGPAFPGPARAFAAATEQYGMLCVFGGTNGAKLADAWAFRPTPLEGTDASGWKRLADLPSPTDHASAVPMGQAHIALVSGDATAAGAPDRANVQLFHSLTDAWCAFEPVPRLTKSLATKLGSSIIVLGEDVAGAPAALRLEASRSVRNLAWLDYVVIVAYFGLISGIGVYFSRKQESSAEFSLGNRKVVWWAAGISMFATGASAISFMAIRRLPSPRTSSGSSR